MSAFGSGEMRTMSYPTLRLDHIPDDAIVMYAQAGSEERSALPVWADLATQRPENQIAILDQKRDRVTAKRADNLAIDVLLARDSQIAALLQDVPQLIIDISGLQHAVWAPILRAALNLVPNVSVIYAEPAEYRRHTNPTSSSDFDLTDGFDGVSSLPGFAKLRVPGEDLDLSLFVPLLGFEGVRARQVAQHFDPCPRTLPLIGVPGFRAEYPAHAISCNREFLLETNSFDSIRLADASSPFDVLDVLENIRRDFPSSYMYLAPIGTKPHALGAVLFAIAHAENTELLYDNPRRKPGRTKGVGQVHIYSIKET